VKQSVLLSVVAVIGLSVIGSVSVSHTALATGGPQTKEIQPVVFQAAGPTIESIQSMVDAFRLAVGAQNGNTPGPLPAGRREINWDGGGSTATSLVPTPFDGFLVTRGARFITPGSGFVQAPLDGLVTTFANGTYADIFQAFSPVRLFSPIDSNLTKVQFFVPGGGELPATTTAFGAIFSDVDQTSASKSNSHSSGKKDRGPDPNTSLAFYDVRGKLLFTSPVPPSAGDGSLSFLGVVFPDARIGSVKIRSGNVAPGPNDSSRRDIVMMDDFIFGEPQMVLISH
jgi:hypothetical protein